MKIIILTEEKISWVVLLTLLQIYLMCGLIERSILISIAFNLLQFEVPGEEHWKKKSGLI